MASAEPPNGLELSCPAEAGALPSIVAHTGGLGALHHARARRVSFSELLGGRENSFSLSIDVTQVHCGLRVDSIEKQSRKFYGIESGGIEDRQGQPSYSHLTGIGL